MHFLDLDDPYTLLYFAPIMFAVLYVLISFFGERGK